MFSKSCEYGLRASIFVAKQSVKNNKVGVKHIAEAIDSPEAFTAKVLQKLVKNKIITSVKGPYGGFFIDEKQITISISKIVEVIDGNDVFTRCGLGLNECSDTSPCPLHNKFISIRNDLHLMLKNTSLLELVNYKSDVLKRLNFKN
ncbi:MAG: Rrf2 family transcriptional regulator [Flavobacteriales bacterium]|nr:Rrf2 family transcriptional regulator [Flavobacteriales bacterium]